MKSTVSRKGRALAATEDPALADGVRGVGEGAGNGGIVWRNLAAIDLSDANGS